MRTSMRAAISAIAILSAGSAIPNRAEAMFAGSTAVGVAAESVAPVENVWWCGWRCHRLHRHAFFFHRFHHRHAFFFHRRFHPGFAFARPCTWC